MPFKDVLKLLYERGKERKELQNQDEFATKHGIRREHMNQFLTGNKPVPPKTAWEILRREGYDLNDCIFLPDVDAYLSRKHPLITQHLHYLLELEGNIPAMVTDAIEAWYEGNQPVAPKKKRAERPHL